MSGESEALHTRNRVISLVAYLLLLILIQWKVVASGFTPNENAIWLYSGFASLLFGSRLLNPHFTPPADAATNGFVAFAALIAGSLVVTPWGVDSWLLWAVAGFCALVCATAVLSGPNAATSADIVTTPIARSTQRERPWSIATPYQNAKTATPRYANQEDLTKAYYIDPG